MLSKSFTAVAVGNSCSDDPSRAIDFGMLREFRMLLTGLIHP
jgi:hypothetical protein